MNDIFPEERIMKTILMLRWEKVLLDRDLAELYGVETRVLNQSVSRNIERFPNDFMFQLDNTEFQNLKSQFVTSSWGWARKRPFAFTEYGILMLSNVLKSTQALHVSIAIIRVFSTMRKVAMSYDTLAKRIHHIEQEVLWNNDQIQELWFEIKKIMTEEEPDNERKIGFQIE